MHRPRSPIVLLVGCVLGWCVAGLGHWVIGERVRGTAIAGSVFGLVLIGLLIGGVSAVDSRDQRWWFAMQVPAGPVVLAVDWAHQHRFKGLFNGRMRLPVEGETVIAEPSPRRDGVRRVIVGSRDAAEPTRWLARPASPRGTEVGLLSVTLAGLVAAMSLVDLVARLGASARADRPPEGAEA